MENLIIPKDYHSELNLHDTQIAIKTVKDFFQGVISLRVTLSRVSAPLFVDPLSSALLLLILRSRMARKPRSYSLLQNGRDMR